MNYPPLTLNLMIEAHETERLDYNLPWTFKLVSGETLTCPGVRPIRDASDRHAFGFIVQLELPEGMELVKKQ